MQLLQEDLELEQVRVNSLTHMVVVVDESSGDSATAALESKLQVRAHTHTDTHRHTQTHTDTHRHTQCSVVGRYLTLKQAVDRRTLDKQASVPLTEKLNKKAA